MLRVSSLTELERKNSEKSDQICMHGTIYDSSSENGQCKGGDGKGDDTLDSAKPDLQENIGVTDDVRRAELWTARSKDITVYTSQSPQSIKTTDQDKKIPPKNSWRSFDWSAEELNKPPKVPPHLKPLKKPKEFIPERRTKRFVVNYQRWLYLLIVLVLIAVISYITNYIYSILTVWMYYTNLLKNKYKNQTTTTPPAARFLRGNADLVPT